MSSERDQVLDILDEWLNSDDHLSLFKWEVREKIRELRKEPEEEENICEGCDRISCEDCCWAGEESP